MKFYILTKENELNLNYLVIKDTVKWLGDSFSEKVRKYNLSLLRCVQSK